MKKPTLTKVKKKAWKQFSLFIRLRDSLKTMRNNRQCKCISCGTIKNTRTRPCIQAGHFIAGRHNAILFSEEMVNGQCYHCNMGLKGNWVPYEEAMVEMYGQERVAELKRLSKVGVGQKRIKYTIQDYLDIEAKYKKKVIDLGGFE
ncbi:hypothetical protein LCGC14_2260890 [marine sediment metagenome]|uniref:Protein ninG n=1 Tax=marine sediment metagenome TaxID=412755 RepID=A0A0F9CZR5_9ZZZZ